MARRNNKASRRIGRRALSGVAAATAFCLLSFSRMPSAFAAEDADAVTSDCTVELCGADRPMYTEKEMKLFDKTFEECTKEITDEDSVGGKPEFEYIEVKSQDWDAGTTRRGRELAGGSTKNSVSTRTKCRRCDTEMLYRRRLFSSVGGRALLTAMTDFDVCMKNRFDDKARGEKDLAALDLGVDGRVLTTCELTVMHDPPIADVLGENANGSNVSDTQICTTEIAGASSPMLMESEMAHFDRCMIDEYNKIYGHYLDTHMVENEICEQDPTGVADVTARLRRLGLGGGQHGRKLVRIDGNKVLSRSGSCRRCKDGGLIYDRRRRRLTDLDHRRRRLTRDFQLHADFDRNFCACLMEGSDHDGNETHAYPAFAGSLTCSTRCTADVPTIPELEAEAEETRLSFQTMQDEEKAKFDKEWKEKEEHLKKQEVELKLKKDRFDFSQKEDQALFEVYQEAHYQEQLVRIRSQCVIPKAKFGQCDGIEFPPDMITVKEAKTTGAKFEIHQNFAYDPASEECDETKPGFDEVRFLARFVKDEVKDDEPPEHDCKYEEKKCGESVEYETKHCYFDQDSLKMVADVEISFDRLDLIESSERRRRRGMRGLEFAPHIGRELADDEMCLKAREDAEQGIHNTCFVAHKIDCDCDEAGI